MPFKKGHRLSVGNRGGGRDPVMTLELISMLNELDSDTQRPLKHEILLELVRRARGLMPVYKEIDVEETDRKSKKKVKVKKTVLAGYLQGKGEIEAIREIINRSDGRVPDSILEGLQSPLNIQIIETVVVDPADRHKLLENEELRVVGSNGRGDETGSSD